MRQPWLLVFPPPAFCWEEETLEADDFVRWWEQVRPDVLAILRRYTAWLGAAISPEDVEQDLAYLAWKGRSQFLNQEHFRRWVRQRAKWLAIDRLRTNHKAREVFSQVEKARERENVASPESLIGLREILSAIERLPPQQRRVMHNTFEGKSERQLAEELDIELRSDGWLMDGQGISPQQGLEKR